MSDSLAPNAVAIFFAIKLIDCQFMNQFGWRDGRADNAQALKACDPLGRVGSNPTPSATNTLTV